MFEKDNKFDTQLIDLNQIKFTLFFKKEVVILDDLMKELEYKDGSNEFDKLFMAKLKDGLYLNNYNLNLFSFFNQSEENFFILDNCLVDNYFCLPKDEEDKKQILNYLHQKDPKLSAFLEEFAFSYDELHTKKSYLKK